MKINLKLTNGTKGSQSAKRLAVALSSALGYRVLRTLKTTKRKQLCYGQGTDKIAQYKYFQAQGLSALEHTTNPNTAMEWCVDSVVIGRKLLSSSCGKGIVIFDIGSEPHGCLVYTKYKKKKREFRIHVFKDKVVAIVEKKLRSDWDGPRDTKIRNLANGYVFCQAPVDIPQGIKELAIAAGKAVVSDFKGVDIGYNEKDNYLFIIEVNSAPGMQGSNVDAYVKTIVNYLNG